MTHKRMKAALIVFAGLAIPLASSPALADAIDITFLQPTLTVTPGKSIAVFGTITNTSTDIVFFNSDNLTVPEPPATAVNDRFLVGVPIELAAGDSSGLLEPFSFSVLPTATGGQYTGTYDLYGGVGIANDNNFDFLGSQTVTIQIPQATTVTAEPASVLLLACGLILFWLSGHSKKRWVLATLRSGKALRSFAQALPHRRTWAIYSCFGALILFAETASALRAAENSSALIVTASSATKNQLLVYNSSGSLAQTLATQGAGGVSGNSGGIEAHGNLLAVVNFGSQSVSVFEDRDQHFALRQRVHTVSKPVSVAFGADHLYILGATTVESHHIYDSFVDPSADGMTTLLKADGSAAQVGFFAKPAHHYRKEQHDRNGRPLRRRRTVRDAGSSAEYSRQRKCTFRPGDSWQQCLSDNRACR